MELDSLWNQYRKNRTRIKKKTRKMIWMVPASDFVNHSTGCAYSNYRTDLRMVDTERLFVHGTGTCYRRYFDLVNYDSSYFILHIDNKDYQQSTRELEDVNDILLIWNHLGKWRPVVILAWLIAMYCCVTNFTGGHLTRLLYYSPTHPLGHRIQLLLM